MAKGVDKYGKYMVEVMTFDHINYLSITFD